MLKKIKLNVKVKLWRLTYYKSDLSFACEKT